MGLGPLEGRQAPFRDGTFRFNTTEMTVNFKWMMDAVKRTQAICVVSAEGRKGQTDKQACMQATRGCG